MQEMAYSHAKSLVTFNAHWEQTVAERKQKRQTDVVAPELQKFQSIQHWPRSGQPLPEDLRFAVQQKHFTWAGLALPITLCIVGLLLTPAALIYGVIYCGITKVCHPGVRIGIIFGLVILTIVICIGACELAKMGLHSQHVAALHLLYVDSKLPLSDSRQEAFSTLLGKSYYKIYLNGDIEIVDVRYRPPPSAELFCVLQQQTLWLLKTVMQALESSVCFGCALMNANPDVTPGSFIPTVSGAYAMQARCGQTLWPDLLILLALSFL